jgi:hypothetical protein
MAIEIEVTPKMEQQMEFAEELAENLSHQVTMLDILDALAVSGVTIEPAQETNHASLAYISLLAQANK